MSILVFRYLRRRDHHSSTNLSFSRSVAARVVGCVDSVKIPEVFGVLETDENSPRETRESGDSAGEGKGERELEVRRLRSVVRPSIIEVPNTDSTDVIH